MAPFSHELYGCAKYTGHPNSFEIISCSANSVPLSVVMLLTVSFASLIISTTACANGAALFPVSSFLIRSNELYLSTNVTIVPFPPFPTIVSISQSPTLSANPLLGRSSIDTLFLIGKDLFNAVLPYFFPLCLKHLRMLSL